MAKETLRVIDLPCELVEEEILTRVPATSLRRLRFTCKRWNALFKDPEFIKKHLDKATKQSMALMLSKLRIYSVSVKLHRIHNNVVIDPSTLLSLTDFHNSKKVKITKIFVCDGLLCTTRDLRLVVWNPCTGQTRWIQYSSHFRSKSQFFLGYENSKSCRSYKILRYNWTHHDLFRRFANYEIYDFSSESWRDALSDFTACICYEITKGVSLKGNIYRLVVDEQSLEDVLLSFDFSTERFKCMSLELPKSDALALSVVREEQLSVLYKRIDAPKIEIWMTTDDVTKVLSLSKFLSVDISENIHHKCLFSIRATFFIDVEKKAAVLCGLVKSKSHRDMVYIVGEDSVYIKIDGGGYTYPLLNPRIYSYVPSLAQIQ